MSRRIQVSWISAQDRYESPRSKKNWAVQIAVAICRRSGPSSRSRERHRSRHTIVDRDDLEVRARRAQLLSETVQRRTSSMVVMPSKHLLIAAMRKLNTPP